jgi:SAM-dependent methyltransferase
VSKAICMCGETTVDLPSFTDNDTELKNQRMDNPSAPPLYVQHFLKRAHLALGRSSHSSVRILDVGCGRGDTVAWLLSRGWEAYGVDISAGYLERGRQYLREVGADPERLRAIQGDSAYPFDNEFFDVVISDQVIEHVADLPAFCREVARVSASGGIGLHIFPAKWRPIEVHLQMPLVHWLPKGPIRRAGISGALRLGLGVPFFRDLPPTERLEIFNRFSDTETYYRSASEVAGRLTAAGLQCDIAGPSRDKLKFHLPGLPQLATGGLGWVYRNMFSTVINTMKA